METDDRKPRPDRDAGHGGSEAPPASGERNRAPTRRSREYGSASIRVQWFPDRCIHSGECIRALPAVFDAKRRPWIDAGAATADEVARAVERCPTGALHYVRLDGGPGETPLGEVTVRTVRNGPYLLRGDIKILGHDGTVLREDSRVALCRCGKSEHMPFCDNSHRASGFRDRSSPADRRSGGR